MERKAAPVVKVLAENRRARFDFEVVETTEAGLALTGSEVKSLRAGKGSIAEAWVRFDRGEAYLHDAHIQPYSHAGYAQHEPRRPRKLLLHAHQLERWMGKVAEKGLTVIPLELRFVGPWVKVEIALGRGRKTHDKREAIKERETRRELQRTGGRPDAD
jgi:SsrA-binding protein